ncbi:VWD domain-containing protein [Lapillicoccus jejuensis]|nr:VWD domain-containing protein [Lapillicoccus jejuensis]
MGVTLGVSYKSNECYGGDSEDKRYPEAIAQARFINRMNRLGVHGSVPAGLSAPTVGGVTPNIQWEVRIRDSITPRKPEDTKLYDFRLDVVLYNAAVKYGEVSVVELKAAPPAGDGFEAAQRQVSAYVRQLKNYQVPAVPADFFAAANPWFNYLDNFRIVTVACGHNGSLVEESTNYVVHPVGDDPSVNKDGKGVLMIDYQDETRVCNPSNQPPGPPIVKRQSDGLRKPEPTDIGNHPSWADCMRNAGGLVVNGAAHAEDVIAESTSYASESLGIAAASTLPVGATLEGIAAGTETVTAGGVITAEAGGAAAAAAIPVAVVAAGVTLGIAGSCAINPNVFGDPHLITLDGLPYDLQGVGEYHLLEAGNGSLDVQARYVPMAGSDSISVLGGIAIRSHDQTVEIQPGGTVLIDGYSSDLASDGIESLDDGLLVIKSGDTVTVVSSDPGLIMRWSGNTFGIKPMDGVATKGLLGNHDGDPSNDMVSASGEQFSRDTPSHSFYADYADSWRITDAESAFTYPGGASTSTYTNVKFPANVKKLADFSQSVVSAATQQCRTNGVTSPSALESCVYDLATTGDASFVKAAAAVPESVTDGNQPTFDANGTLSEDFQAPVPAALAANTYLTPAAAGSGGSGGSGGGRIAGPFFDDAPYNVALVNVPRHDALTVGFTAHLIGALTDASTPQSMTLTVGDQPAGTVTFHDTSADAAGPASGSGAQGAQVTAQFNSVQTLPNGQTDHVYKITAALAHTATSLRFSLQTIGIHGVTSSGLGVSDLSFHVTAPPAQVMDVTLPATVQPDVPAPGAGRIETGGAEDDYRFNLGTDDATRGLVVDTSCDVAPYLHLVSDATGQVFSGAGHGGCGTQTFATLSPGSYHLAVAGLGRTFTYSLKAYLWPAPQSFSYQVGQLVEPGKIGGVAADGAGALETSTSKDSYTFTVPAGGQSVVFDSGYESQPGLGFSHLIRLADGKDYGPVDGHRVFSLDPGDYRIDVERAGWIGTYSFVTTLKAAPQSFSYQVGQLVEPGKIGGVAADGAGALETSTSKDSYTFTVPAGGQSVVFDSGYESQPGLGFSHLIRLADGKDYGPVDGHRVFSLDPGDYRIDVERAGWIGTYSFVTTLKAAPQSFSYQVGQLVEPGKIGGVAADGAGALETSTSKDSYTFTVPAGGQSVVFDSGYESQPGLGFSHLIRLADGKDYGPVDGHRVFSLDPGDYRIDVERAGWIGTYSFVTTLKAAPQSFSYQVGQLVEPGKIGGVAADGAGALETSTSKDSYTFTVAGGAPSGQGGQADPTPQTVVFDSGYESQPGLGFSHLIRLADGKDYGPVDGHRVFSLDPGDYRIDVERAGWIGTYSFVTTLKAAPQSFSYQVGQLVEPGKIGGVAADGAGALETSTSKDSYTFTVPAGGQSVVFDSGYESQPGLGFSHLIRLADGKDYGPVDGHRVFSLDPGDYRIDVERAGWIGTYSFVTTLKAAPQSFSADLAMNKTATQSSTGWGGDPSRAVDGNTSGNFNDNSVTHTQYQANPWWQVDLGSSQSLSDIRVWNRTDCCSTRTTDYWVFVSNTPFDTSLSPAQQARVPGVWSSHQTGQMISPTDVTLPGSTQGRYVLVQLNGSDYLHIAEVEAFG